ncbi:hypothetical protein ACGFWE_43030 [Streptomyces sp. NPDC048523]|uniref:hypothetical protein n=1 Tax=Streptomyces sp. NPDC048523 TaxID=3365567 RepID=UPI00371C1A86
MADVAEELVRFRRLPDVKYQEEWEDARDVQAAADGFRRSRLALGPFRLPEDGSASDFERESGSGVQLMIDTGTDTFEQVVTAVRAVYRRGAQA